LQVLDFDQRVGCPVSCPIRALRRESPVNVEGSE
jgi:hypothetical protein